MAGTVYGAADTAFTDSGLLAETTYTYTVTAFDAAGNASAAGTPASVTTPPIAVQAPVWSAPMSGGKLKQGSDVAIRLAGDPGMGAEAEIAYLSWYGTGGALLEAPAPDTATVALAEDAAQPGTYTGAFTVPAGTSEVRSITGVLSDPAGHHTSAAP